MCSGPALVCVQASQRGGCGCAGVSFVFPFFCFCFFPHRKPRLHATQSDAKGRCAPTADTPPIKATVMWILKPGIQGIRFRGPSFQGTGFWGPGFLGTGFQGNVFRGPGPRGLGVPWSQPTKGGAGTSPSMWRVMVPRLAARGLSRCGTPHIVTTPAPPTLPTRSNPVTQPIPAGCPTRPTSVTRELPPLPNAVHPWYRTTPLHTAPHMTHQSLPAPASPPPHDPALSRHACPPQCSPPPMPRLNQAKM